VRDLVRLVADLLAVPVVPVVRTPHAAAPAAVTVVIASKLATVNALKPVTVTAWNPVNVTNTVAPNAAHDLL